MDELSPHFPHIQSAGEQAFIIYFGDRISEGISKQVCAMATRVRRSLGCGMIDLIPSYASLLVLYDPLQVGHSEIRRMLEDCLKQPSTATEDAPGREVTLPVFYSAEAGPDLLSLAQAKDLSLEDVIRLHHERVYRVYALGFAPGFAYLGQVNERLATSRLATPRAKVPRGAVGIADQQTAVYPSESPGGWNLIGRCPVRMFDPNALDALKVNVGDRVRFEPIDRGTFLGMGGEL
jgi:KipI family sensor histidine kinase inhibitor